MLKDLPKFLLAPLTKEPPLVKDWPARARHDITIPAGYNYGIHTTGLCVIDVDIGGEHVFDLLQQFEGGWPDTFTVRTPSGGKHLYYRMPTGVHARNTVGVLGDGIDTRGHRGYVVGPGSKTPQGAYTIERDVTIADAPAWLVAKIAAAPAQEPKRVDIKDAEPLVLERAAEWLAGRPGATEGQGGDAHTYVTACGLRDFGVSKEQAFSLMLDWNERCSPPWSPEDLCRKVANAYEYAQSPPGAAIARVSDFHAVDGAPRARRLLEVAFAGRSPGGYVVKGLLSLRSYAMIYGPPGAGKTFVALDIAYHVAAGQAWMNRRVKTAPVLYLAYEGLGGLSKRARALVHHYGDKDIPLYLMAAGFDLRAGDSRRALAKEIAALPEAPGLIVFDTFAHALCGGDENSAQDVGAFNAGVAALLRTTDACVLVLHHPKKSGDSARGSSALLGAVDTEIVIADHVIRPTKQRDVELGESVGFRLQPVTIDIDDDGEPVTSCVVVPAAAQLTDPAEALRDKYKLAWEALCDLRSNNTPITDADWRQACSEFIYGPRARKSWFEVKSKLLRMRLVEQVSDNTFRRRTT